MSQVGPKLWARAGRAPARMNENASAAAATQRIIPSLPRAHLDHAELPLGSVVFDLEASCEIRPEAKAGLLSWPDLLLYVVAVQV
jgi:hypothetical protein